MKFTERRIRFRDDLSLEYVVRFVNLSFSDLDGVRWCLLLNFNFSSAPSIGKQLSFIVLPNQNIVPNVRAQSLSLKNCFCSEFGTKLPRNNYSFALVSDFRRDFPWELATTNAAKYGRPAQKPSPSSSAAAARVINMNLQLFLFSDCATAMLHAYLLIPAARSVVCNLHTYHDSR